MADRSDTHSSAISKADEWRVFILLAVFLAPAVSIALVGSYGFLIWMSQLVFGPPAH